MRAISSSASARPSVPKPVRLSVCPSVPPVSLWQDGRGLGPAIRHLCLCRPVVGAQLQLDQDAGEVEKGLLQLKGWEAPLVKLLDFFILKSPASGDCIQSQNASQSYLLPLVLIVLLYHLLSYLSPFSVSSFFFPLPATPAPPPPPPLARPPHSLSSFDSP